MELPKLKFISKNEFNSEISNYDALVVIFNFEINNILETQLLQLFSECISNQYSVDASIGSAISILYTEGAPGNRIVLSPTKSAFDEIDDGIYINT